MIVFTMMLACANPEDDERVAAILELEGVAVDGEQVYLDNCSGCHGADATGASGPDLVGHLDHHGDAEYIETILYGGLGDMAAYEDVLEDQEVADIMAFLKSL